MVVGGDENARFQFSYFASMEIVYTFLILFMFNYPTETAAYDMMMQQLTWQFIGVDVYLPSPV